MNRGNGYAHSQTTLGPRGGGLKKESPYNQGTPKALNRTKC
jgi:hypothetical protein